MKVTIAFSCEDSSMLTGTIIDVESGYNYSLHVIISLVPITCLHFGTTILYI